MSNFIPTDEQLEIIEPEEWTSSVITASAGSGKTTTIIRRAINQVDTFIDNEPWKNIAIISFTHKSADDIKSKVQSLNGHNIIAMTFHSFLIRHILSFTQLFRGQNNIHFDYSKRVSSLSDWCHHIRDNHTIPLSNNRKNDYVFEYTLQAFDDNPYIKKYLQSKFCAIYIDEAQDNNPLQYNIVSMIIELGIQVVLIGDPNQTIYGFRGANVNNFTELESDMRFPNYYMLTRNFRCHENINSCANSYSLPTLNNIDENNHGVFIQNAEEFQYTFDNFNNGLCFLFRGLNNRRNQINRNIIQKFQLPLISQPDILSSSSSPFYLNKLFLMYFGDYKEKLNFIEDVLSNIHYKKAKNLLTRIKNNPNYENLRELNSYVGEYSESEFDKILSTFHSEGAQRFYRLDNSSNFAMTIHASKGLEFRNIVLMCHDFSNIYTDDDKNIFYVACTRAEARLFFLNL